MDNDTQDKASYQLNRFLFDKKHIALELNVYDLVILQTIARYLDLPQKWCSMTQENFAAECRMDKREFMRRTKLLVEKKIIFRYVKKQCYFYELGEEVTGIPNG